MSVCPDDVRPAPRQWVDLVEDTLRTQLAAPEQ